MKRSDDLFDLLINNYYKYYDNELDLLKLDILEIKEKIIEYDEGLFQKYIKNKLGFNYIDGIIIGLYCDVYNNEKSYTSILQLKYNKYRKTSLSTISIHDSYNRIFNKYKQELKNKYRLEKINRILENRKIQNFLKNNINNI